VNSVSLWLSAILADYVVESFFIGTVADIEHTCKSEILVHSRISGVMHLLSLLYLSSLLRPLIRETCR